MKKISEIFKKKCLYFDDIEEKASLALLVKCQYTVCPVCLVPEQRPI